MIVTELRMYRKILLYTLIKNVKIFLDCLKCQSFKLPRVNDFEPLIKRTEGDHVTDQ